ncbi:MAG: prepilin-type N-terminal cleavage/methylation domain-containing protein [Bryobacteraceae bacterium]|jgi:prepilin-type N-terminal cleavage/methylation domain-containing protein
MRNSRRRGFTLIELLIVVAIILIIAAIAVPKIDKARMAAQEMAAVEQVKTIQAGEAMYYSQFGQFATKLEELGPPAGGPAGPSAADLIPGDLAKGIKTGYQFILIGGPAGYTVNANPVSFNSTGRRTFFSDQSHVIHENWGAEPATINSPEIK